MPGKGKGREGLETHFAAQATAGSGALSGSDSTKAGTFDSPRAAPVFIVSNSAGAPGGRRAAVVRFVESLAVVMPESVVHVGIQGFQGMP